MQPLNSVDYSSVVWLEVTEIKKKRVKSGTEMNSILKSFSIRLEFVIQFSGFLGRKRYFGKLVTALKGLQYYEFIVFLQQSDQGDRA